MSHNPFKEIMNEDIKRFESYSEGIGEAIRRNLSRNPSITNPFKLVMNEQAEMFEAHAERIKESIERELSQSALVTNPFKLVMNEQQEVIAPLAEKMQANIANRLSSSVALGDMINTYFKISLEAFFSFNAVVLEGINEQLRLSAGKTLASVTVKTYEYLAKYRSLANERVSTLDIDGIFEAYKPIDLIFDMPFDDQHVKEILPQRLATIFRQVGITEFRLSKLENDGLKLQIEVPQANAPSLFSAFAERKFKEFALVSLEVSEEYEEVFPIPFEHEIKRVIRQIEQLLDLRKLEQALSMCLNFFANYRLLRPQSQVFMLQGDYAYLQNNRAAFTTTAIALEEDRIAKVIRDLLSGLV